MSTNLNGQIVVFDTNAYRTKVHGLSIEETRELYRKLSQNEQKDGIYGVANPYALIELLGHLADRTDPAYDDCLKSVVAMYHHCAGADGMIRIMPPNEAELARSYWGMGKDEEVAQLLTVIVKQIGENPGNINHVGIKKLTQWLSERQASFIRAIDYIANQRGIRDAIIGEGTILQLRERGEIQDFFARIILINARKSEVAVTDADDFEGKVKSMKERYCIVLEMIGELFQRTDQNGCNLEGDKWKRWYIDIQVTFYVGAQHSIGGKQIVLVTDDRVIHEMAAKIGCGAKVEHIDDYYRKYAVLV